MPISFVGDASPDKLLNGSESRNDFIAYKSSRMLVHAACEIVDSHWGKIRHFFFQMGRSKRARCKFSPECLAEKCTSCDCCALNDIIDGDQTGEFRFMAENIGAASRCGLIGVDMIMFG